MTRFLYIAFLCLTAVLCGCNGNERKRASLEGIKITDVAPIESDNRGGGRSIKSVNVDVYRFEVPAEHMAELNEVWQKLSGMPFRFKDAAAFSANLFSTGVGKVEMWDEIAALLEAAKARRMGAPVSLMLFPGQTNDVFVGPLYEEQTVYYTSKGGSTHGITVGPGTFVLRIIAEEIAGSRGTFAMIVKPMHLPRGRKMLPWVPERARPIEFPFTAAGFAVQTSPGDLVLLGPADYRMSRSKLGGAFFTSLHPRPVVRTLLIVCKRINY